MCLSKRCFVRTGEQYFARFSCEMNTMTTEFWGLEMPSCANITIDSNCRPLLATNIIKYYFSFTYLFSFYLYFCLGGWSRTELLVRLHMCSCCLCCCLCCRFWCCLCIMYLTRFLYGFKVQVSLPLIMSSVCNYWPKLKALIIYLIINFEYIWQW